MFFFVTVVKVILTALSAYVHTKQTDNIICMQICVMYDVFNLKLGLMKI